MSIARIVTVGVALLALIALGAPPPASAELKVSLGGYVKLDMEYQDRLQTGAGKALPAVQAIPFTSGPSRVPVSAKNDQFLLEARESRLNVTATDTVAGVKIKGFFEADFNGDAAAATVVSSHELRLRHAFGEGTMPFGIGTLTLLAGQWWSAFGVFPTLPYPSVIDFSGSPAAADRQPQVRLTYGIPVGKDTLNLIAAVQAQAVAIAPRDGTGALTPGVTTANQEGQNVPAFVGKVQWLSSLVGAEVGVIVSKAKVTLPAFGGAGTPGSSAGGDADDEFVYGVMGTIRVPIGPLTISGNADYMQGVNSQATGAFSDVTLKAAGAAGRARVFTINTVGFWGGVSYALTPTTSFNGLYRHRFAEDSGNSGFGRSNQTCGGIPCSQADNMRLQKLNVNVLQKFWERFQFGVEFERLWRDTFRNNHATANIYHAAFWYFF